MTPTEERMQQAEQKANHTINELNRALRNATVWGGMDWHYNPLHPMYVKKCLDLIRAYHADKLKPAIEVFSNPTPSMVESKVTTTFTSDLCEEIDRLESQLNNIACIVAELKASFITSCACKEPTFEMPSRDMRRLIADLECALKAKGRLLGGNDLGQNLEGTPQECPKPSNGLAFNALGVLVPSTTAKTEGREISTAQFPAYAVLLHVNDEYAGTDYWDVHHIEPVAGDEPGAALNAYNKAVKHLLACRKHINSAKAYLVCMNLIAGPDTDLSDLEGGNPSET